MRETVSFLPRSTILRSPLSKRLGSSPLSHYIHELLRRVSLQSLFLLRLTSLLITGWSLRFVTGPDSKHWIVLFQQIAVRLLRSVANSPRYVSQRLVSCVPPYPDLPSAAASSNHLRIFDSLLSPTSSARSLGERSDDLRTNITLYVMQRGLYPLLAKALGDIVRF